LMRRWVNDRSREDKLGLLRMLRKFSSNEPTKSTSAKGYNNIVSPVKT
jgi:hypothetical protein